MELPRTIILLLAAIAVGMATEQHEQIGIQCDSLSYTVVTSKLSSSRCCNSTVFRVLPTIYINISEIRTLYIRHMPPMEAPELLLECMGSRTPLTKLELALFSWRETSMPPEFDNVRLSRMVSTTVKIVEFPSGF